MSFIPSPVCTKRLLERKLSRFNLQAVDQGGVVWCVEKSRKAVRVGSRVVVADVNYPVTQMKPSDAWWKPLFLLIGTTTVSELVRRSVETDEKEREQAALKEASENLRESLKELSKYLGSKR